MNKHPNGGALKAQTSFMGVSINENGPQHLIILKALAHPSQTILGIDKFIEVTDFKLNMVMFDCASRRRSFAALFLASDGWKQAYCK